MTLNRRATCCSSILLASFCVLALCVPVSAAAEEQDARPRTHIRHYSEGEVHANLERILTRAAEVELRSALIEVLPEIHDIQNGPEEVSRASGVGAPREEILLELTDNLEGELFLVGTYTVERRRISLHYRLIDVQRQEVLAEIVREGEIDLVVDRLVADSVQGLLAQIEGHLVELRQERAQMLRSQTSPDPPGEIPGGGEHRAGPSEIHSASLRLELGVSGSTIVSIGEFAPYIPYGYLLRSTLTLWLGEGEVRFGLGASAGYQRMLPAEEGMAAVVRSFVPLGIDMSISARESSAISPRIELSGGVAIRIDDGSTASERIATAIPYASAGVGANFSFNDQFALGAFVSMRSLFHIYQERGESESKVEPIIGILPGLSVFYRL